MRSAATIKLAREARVLFLPPLSPPSRRSRRETSRNAERSGNFFILLSALMLGRRRTMAANDFELSPSFSLLRPLFEKPLSNSRRSLSNKDIIISEVNAYPALSCRARRGLATLGERQGPRRLSASRGQTISLHRVLLGGKKRTGPERRVTAKGDRSRRGRYIGFKKDTY